MRRRIIPAVTVLTLCIPAPAFAGQLAVGRVTAQNGKSVTVPVTYRQGNGPAAVALGTDIAFNPSGLSNPRCAAGSAVSTSGPAAKLVACSEPSKGVVRLAVLGLNVEPLPDGEVATVTFDVAPSTRHRRFLLRHTPGGADASGTDFRLARRSGSIRTK